MPIPFAVLTAFIVTVVMTPLIGKLAGRFGILDRPDSGRKRHVRVTPLMGGVAILAGLTVAVAVAQLTGALPGEHIKGKFLIGILLASALLVFGGTLDDKFDFSPWKQIIWPILAALVVVASGIGVTFITNPFGGQLYLNEHVVTVLWWQDIPYKLTLLADIFTVVWLLTMTYTTKFLDGLDGLVGGVTVIGGFVIAAVSMMRDVSQPDTAILALIVAAAFFGFLLFNFHPARIFLGEGGSTLAGFLLGVLAIISGGKIATTLLVLGLPLFDAGTVVLRRLIERRSPARADRSHLHFRLLDIGFSPRLAVLTFYLVAVLFGSATLFLKGGQKLVALTVIAALFFLLGSLWTATLRWRRKDGSDREVQ